MTLSRRFLILTLLSLAGLAGLAGVGPAHAAESRPLQVVASFSVLADMVRAVAGDAATVTSLVPPNADAHVYEPTPADVRRLAAADLVVVNGLRFEGWMERLVRISGYRGPLVVATQGVTPRRVNGVADPHAWQSLAHARRYVDNIRAALVLAAPDKAAAIEARANEYLAQLERLDQNARTAFRAIPEDRRRVITSHDAFGYLAEAYGISFSSPRGWTTHSEPSARDVARVIRQIRAQQARALFVENISDTRLIERIAKESGATVGGTLYSDALSLPGTEAESYLKMMAHNVDALLAALR